VIESQMIFYFILIVKKTKI